MTAISCTSATTCRLHVVGLDSTALRMTEDPQHSYALTVLFHADILVFTTCLSCWKRSVSVSSYPWLSHGLPWRALSYLHGHIPSGSPAEGSVPDSPAGSFASDLSQMLTRGKSLKQSEHYRLISLLRQRNEKLKELFSPSHQLLVDIAGESGVSRWLTASRPCTVLQLHVHVHVYHNRYWCLRQSILHYVYSTVHSQLYISATSV